MDPISALSVACNVLQLIQQAIEAAGVCKELYERGSLDENNKIEKYAEDLTALNKDLDVALNKNPTTIPRRVNQLRRIAKDTSETAAELKKVLSQLKLSKNYGVRTKGGAFLVTLRTIYKRGTVEKLQAKLEQQDAALQSCLVRDLYIRAGEDDLVRQKEFAALSQGQKDAITQLLGLLQHASTDIKASVIAAETNITSSITSAQANITAQLDSQQYAHTKYTQGQESNALRVRVLKDLAFPEMNDRCKMIANRVGEFGDTYRWIFYPPPRTDSHQQHEFVAWLREGQGIFWLSGKPGSGKSSLVSYIYQNLQTGQVGFDHLKAWAQPQSVRLLSFWFFRPATCVLLKSLEGFWRSMCHQILEVDEDLFETIRNNNDGSAPESLLSFFGQVRSHAPTWTDTELKSWFTYLITHSQYHFCILADGLDEVEDVRQRRALLKVIQYIGDLTKKVKVCCSSRPENPFEDALSQYPRLRMQDFNYEDIKLHCHNQLEGTKVASYASRIADHADGVFLWAALVATQILSGVEQGDSDADLNLRLTECPAEMDELLLLLLRRQDPIYAKHPKPYLGLIAAATTTGQEVNLLELLLASQEQNKLAAKFTDYLAALCPDNLVHFCQELSDLSVVELKTNVVARCAGLVECLDAGPSFSHLGSLRMLERTVVHFIHRSVHDFLLDNVRCGTALVDACGISEQEALKRMVLASAIYFIIDDKNPVIRPCMEYSQRVPKSHWTELETTVLDAVFTELQMRYPGTLPLQTADIGDWKSFPHTLEQQEIWCPQLSAVDNRLLHYAGQYCLLPYLEEKLANFDQKSRSLAIGFCILCLIRTGGCLGNIKAVRQMLSLFQTQISWTQHLAIFHPQANFRASFFSTRPLYEHMHLASVALPFQLFISYKTNRQDFLDFYSNLLPENGIRPQIDGWAHVGLSQFGGSYFGIFAVPDLGEASLENLQRGHVLTTSTLLHEPEKLSFSQYAPPGSHVFLDVEPRINQALQRLLIGDPAENDPGDPLWQEHFADILNCHLDRLAPLDIARIVKVSANISVTRLDKASIIFSKGRFRGTAWDEFNLWEKRLRQGKFEEDFGTTPENDLILEKILELFEEHWRENAKHDERMYEDKNEDEDGVDEEHSGTLVATPKG